MFKRNLIRKLHEKGVRYADKAGVGRVSLSHIKNAELAALCERVYNELPEDAEAAEKRE